MDMLKIAKIRLSKPPKSLDFQWRFSVYDTFKVGDTINAKLDPENANNVASYQWLADGAPILDADQLSFVVGEAQIGKAIVCVVKDLAGTEFTSDPTEKVLPAGDITVASVEIDNKAPEVGGTITATAKDADGNDVSAAVLYAWFTGDSAGTITTPVDGAITNTLTVDETMLGKFILVYGTKSGSTELS